MLSEPETVARDMKIDIWSDIVCPFCYVGKRHLELALEGFEHAAEVEITWHSFELDPDAVPVADESLVDKIARKYSMSTEQSEASQRQLAAKAAAVGLDFNWQEARYGNTFDAHRLVHLAAAQGLADAAEERFMRAYFTEGKAIGDPETLAGLAVEIGLDEARVREVLAGTEFADAVRADEAQASAYGISAVPFFVIDGTYGISGAQPVEAFEQALQQIWDERPVADPV